MSEKQKIKLRNISMFSILLWLMLSSIIIPVFTEQKPVSAASDGPNSPSATGYYFNEVLNPTYAYSSDDSYAFFRSRPDADQQDYYNFGLSIPGGVTINSIKLEIEGHGDNRGNPGQVKANLSWNGGSSWTSQQTFDFPSDTTDSTESYNGTWGRSWSQSEFSNKNFRVGIQGTTFTITAIDHIKVTVYYTGNNAPVNNVTDASLPSNNSKSVSLNPTIGIYVSDADGDTMNQSFWTNASGSWQVLCYNNGTTNATLSNTSSDYGTDVFDEYYTTYWISSNVSDGNGGWDNDTWSFTTEFPPSGSVNITADSLGGLLVKYDSSSWATTRTADNAQSMLYDVERRGDFVRTSVSGSFPALYWIGRSYITINTSGIPDTASIDSVKVYIHGYSQTSCDVVVQNWTGGEDGLTVDDFDEFLMDSGSFGINDAWSTGWNEIEFNELGRESINKEGKTYLVFRDYTNDYQNSTPSINTMSGGYYFNSSYPPSLNITYSSNTEPTIEQEYPTGSDISMDCGKINMHVTVNDTDGDSSTVFWKIDTDSNVNDTTMDTHQNTSILNQTAYYNITGLDYNTQYFVGVWANDTHDNTSKYFSFTTLDTTFGYTGACAATYNIGSNAFIATKGTPPSSGYVDNISVYMVSGGGANEWVAGEEVKCLLYDSSLNLIAETEERTSGGSGWQTFNFSEPKPYVEVDTLYYVGVFQDDGITIGYDTVAESDGTGGKYVEIMTYPTSEDPIGSWDSTDTTMSLCIYASYTDCCKPDGSGTEGDPYKITNWCELNYTRNDKSANYSLENDLDKNSTGYNEYATDWTSIADSYSDSFTGTFNGNNYTISYYAIVSTCTYPSLFGNVEGIIEYLNLYNVTIDVSNDYASALCDMNSGSIVRYCTVDTVSIDANDYIGGLVSYMKGTLSHCSAYNVNISGGEALGGLASFVYTDANITNSSAINISIMSESLAGGITGQTQGLIETSYSKNVTIEGRYNIGGLVGSARGEIRNCYSVDSSITRTTGYSSGTFGGFAGSHYQSIIVNCFTNNSVYYDGTTDPTSRGFCGSVTTGGDYEDSGNFFDSDESNQETTSGNALPKTTTEMKTISTFSSWDISYSNVDLNDGYPYLSWQNESDEAVWLISGTTSEVILTLPIVYPTSGVASYTTFDFNVTWKDNTYTPEDGYLKVNISKDGWYTNQSMSFLEGKHTISDSVIDSYIWGLTYDGIMHTKDCFCRLGTSNYFVSAGYGWLSTLEINDNGSIVNSIIDQWEFDVTQGSLSGILHVSDDIYLVYSQDNSDGYLFTTRIWSTNGSLQKTMIDSETYTKVTRHDVIHVIDDIYAVSYQEYSGDYDNFLETYEVTSAGAISSRIDYVEYDSTSTSGTSTCPIMCSVDSNTIAIVYNCRTDFEGRLVTYNISDSGDITDTYADFWEYDGVQSDYAFIKKISGTTYAIAYGDVSGDGQIKTLTISDEGAITESFIDTLEFDTGDCEYPIIFTIKDGSVYGISYMNNNDRILCSINISSSGTIGDSILDSLEYDSTYNYYYAPICYLSDGNHVLCYSTSGNDGKLVTLNIAEGLVYQYSTTLTAGSYTYTFHANNSISYNSSGPHSGPTVSAQSIAVSITTASNGGINFTEWLLDETGVGLTYKANVSEDNQSDVLPAINITNTGNVPLTIYLNWTSNPGSGILAKWNTSNNTPAWDENVIAIDPLYSTLSSELAPLESLPIWVWMNFTAVPAQSVQLDLSIYYDII